MKITTIGIDLAKEVFQIYGVNEHGSADEIDAGQNSH